MSFPRLAVLALPVALCLPMLVGACAAPFALTAASYGADGVSLVESGKTGTDHLASMVSKKDCALWRVFRGVSICHEQDPDNPNPYKVNYDEPFRQVGEGSSVEYSPPAHASAGAPAQSWDAAAYKPAANEPAPPTTAVADSKPPVIEPAAAPSAASQPAKHKPAAKTKKAAKAKKPSPDQVASSR